VIDRQDRPRAGVRIIRTFWTVLAGRRQPQGLPASAARGDRDLAGRLTVGVEPKGGPARAGPPGCARPAARDCGRLLGTVVEGSECFVDVAELPLLAAEEGVADDTVAVDGIEGRTLAE